MGKGNRYNVMLHARIGRKLAAIAGTSSATPECYLAFRRISSESTDSERLIICQAIRDDGRLPWEAGFYLVALQAEEFNRDRDESELLELRRQLKALAATRKPAANAPATSGAEPVESREPREQIDLSCQESRLVDTLIAAGEYDMAALYVKDQDEFNRLRNLGREYFHGKLPAAVEDVDTWLDELVERISEFATWDDPDDGFMYRGYRKSEFWSMIVYPDPVEIVGGANDGAEVVPAFQLDLQGVIGLFDEIDDVCWDTGAIEPSDCPQIRIEGRYEGQYVYLSVLAQPPKKMAEFTNRASQ